MFRKIAVVAAVLVVSWTGCLAYAAEAESAHKKELQKLQGSWVMVSGEMNGQPATDQHVKGAKLTYDGNIIRISVPNQHPELIIADIVKIDPAKSPKEMHFVRRNGPSAGKTLVAIYEFAGDDEYKFAFDPSGSMILKEFVTKEGSGHVRNSWKRVKP